MAAVLAVAAGALAHGTSGIVELEAIDERIDAQLEATTGRTRRAYAKLAKVVRRPSRVSLGLTDDVTKLLATASACHKGPLSSDTELRAALVAPIGDTEQYLAEQPGNVELATRRLERAGDRRRVTAALAASLAARDDGVVRRDAADGFGMLRRYRTAGSQLARAGALFRAFLAKQIRRGSPGQPLKKGLKGTIDTFAGTGVSGDPADGRRALDASFFFPVDVTVEPATGLVYVADQNNHRIRRVDGDGRVRTVVGNGRPLPVEDGAGPAREVPLHHPGGMAFHPVTGDLYIAGWHVARIVRWTQSTDLVDHFAGSGVPGGEGDGGPVPDATFNYPSCVTFATSGAFYVSDQDNHRVRFVDAAGAIHPFAGTGAAGFGGDDGPAADALLANSLGEQGGVAGRCCLDPTETYLYIADTANHRVRRVELATSRITTFAGDGEAGADGDGGLATAAALDEPVDIDCDAAGNVYICDWKQDVVRRVDATTNVITTYAGVAGVPHGGSSTSHYTGDGHPATFARLNGPQGIFMDRERGRLYIADTVNSVVRVVWE